MSTKDVNKENEGNAGGNPVLNKNVIIFATDMSEEMRGSIVGVAQRAFNAPVNQGKVYQTIADLIRTECEKNFDGVGSSGGGDGSKGSGSESSGSAGGSGGRLLGSGGWSCVVGDQFGSSVTHRMKTYIHFRVVPDVNVLLWKT